MRPRKILIYRLGSLGDTVVALPALHLIAKKYPGAQRYVLTNFGNNSKAAQMNAVLEGTGLVQGYIEYPLAIRGLREIFKLRKIVSKGNFDTLIYLAEPRGVVRAWRDALFFFICGIRKLIGIPYTSQLNKPKEISKDMFESHAVMLANRISVLGDAQPYNLESYSLFINRVEREQAGILLKPLVGRKLIAISLGAKIEIKDWGDTNWTLMLTKLADRYPHHGLVAVGVNEESERSEALCKAWNNRYINLCGLASVRTSAAILERCDIFIGHDSGPMHLAAAVGTRCVAIFSSYNLPGVWFPCGTSHKVLYHYEPCYGCGEQGCLLKKKICIMSITVQEVLEAVESILN